MHSFYSIQITQVALKKFTTVLKPFQTKVHQIKKSALINNRRNI